MAASRIDGDLYVTGSLTSGGAFNVSAGSVTNAAVAAAAGISASKLQQSRAKTYAQPNTAATTETRALHIVEGAAGTIKAFRAGSIGVAVGAATVTFDLKKNGTTVLTGVITLDTGNTARVAEAGTLSVTALAAGDLLEIVITATAGGGTLPTGVYCQVTLDEDYAP